MSVDQPILIINDTATISDSVLASKFVQYGIRNAIYSVIFHEGKPACLLSIYRYITPAYWGTNEIYFVEQMTKSLNSIVERHKWEQLISKEKQRADELLLNILPRPIVHKMKQNQTNIAEGVDCVSVMVCITVCH